MRGRQVEQAQALADRQGDEKLLWRLFLLHLVNQLERCHSDLGASLDVRYSTT